MVSRGQIRNCPWTSKTKKSNPSGFPDSSVGKESACNAGDLGSIPGLGRSPGEGKGYPLQYSGLESSKDCVVHGVTKSQAQMSDFHFTSHLDDGVPGEWQCHWWVCHLHPAPWLEHSCVHRTSGEGRQGKQIFPHQSLSHFLSIQTLFFLW